MLITLAYQLSNLPVRTIQIQLLKQYTKTNYTQFYRTTGGLIEEQLRFFAFHLIVGVSAW